MRYGRWKYPMLVVCNRSSAGGYLCATVKPRDWYCVAFVCKRTMQSLSEGLIKRRSKHFDLGCVTLLDLSRAGTVLGGSLR